MTLELIDIFCDIVIFTTACWVVLTGKIIDGVIIKIGSIFVAMGATADLAKDVERMFYPVMMHDYAMNPVLIWMKIGIALIAIGVVLRVCIYPKIVPYFPELRPLNKPIFDRRISDKHIDLDEHDGRENFRL